MSKGKGRRVTETRKVVVIGQGYVGLPLAMHAVDAGYHVVGIDRDESRVKRLMTGDSYIEDVASSQLEHAVASGRYLSSTEYRAAAGFDIAVITVPTPLREGIPDLAFIEDSARELARYIRPGATVILESTTYPGTTEELVIPVLEAGSGLFAGADFHVGYSPERIDPGNPRWTLSTTPKVVSGIDVPSMEAVRRFFDDIVEQTVPVSSCKVAELTKLLENTFRHVNIALVNELAVFAQDLDIDVWEAIAAASTKPFGFLPFKPGPGVGGHCLPIDPSYLSWRVKRTTGHSFRFIELANDINDHMPDYVVRRIVLTLNRRRLAVNGSRILLLGLAYKRDTGDARESPAAKVADLLLRMGAQLRAVDPHVVEAHVNPDIERVSLSVDEVDRADLIVLLTDHASFDLSLLDAAAEKVFDTRNDPRLRSVERL
jgi:UDP-N-acetyl-D-glucosamine dehydrogenase